MNQVKVNFFIGLKEKIEWCIVPKDEISSFFPFLFLSRWMPGKKFTLQLENTQAKESPIDCDQYWKHRLWRNRENPLSHEPDIFPH